jgi:hypothetical protein
MPGISKQQGSSMSKNLLDLSGKIDSFTFPTPSGLALMKEVIRVYKHKEDIYAALAYGAEMARERYVETLPRRQYEIQT